jgi:hypothetical protein
MPEAAMNIIPIRPELAKLKGLSERIASRAADLMRVLGESGRMVLSKHEVRDLMRYMDTRKPADGGTYREFVALEASLRERHGLAVRALAVTADGVVRADRDPSSRHTPKALASAAEARKAVRAKVAPVIDDRSWRIPKARPSGPNIVDFTRRRVASG